MDYVVADADHENSREENLGYYYSIHDSQDEVDFAVFAMQKYVTGELTSEMIPSFDTVYRDYILWPAIFLGRAVLQLPHPRTYAEGVLDSLERDPTFWREYTDRVRTITKLRPCDVESHRVFISKTPYVVETPSGFFYTTKPKTFGIYFAPKNEIDPIVQAALKKSRDDFYTALDDTKSVPEFAPTTGTYNFVKRDDGRYDRQRIGHAI